jgi:hypothetical protein
LHVDDGSGRAARAKGKQRAKDDDAVAAAHRQGRLGSGRTAPRSASISAQGTRMSLDKGRSRNVSGGSAESGVNYGSEAGKRDMSDV